MQTLNLPKTELRLRTCDGRTTVFDPLRRKYVALTPEEWVRQHFTHFLIACKGYPAGLIANEMAITLGNTRKRCDTVVYGQQARPLMILEYKAPHIPLTQQVFDQISRYNIRLHVDWLVVSNGLQHYCCRMDYSDNTYHFLPDIPSYSEIIQSAPAPETATTEQD
ncbi:MAG: type I restriction enzyme HsdR N-terminal domain-containing protein [Bacteroidaceae bacterium]